VKSWFRFGVVLCLMGMLALGIKVLMPSEAAAQATCTPVGFGDTTSGSLDAVGEEDCYSFDGVVGEVFLTRAVRTSGEIELEMRMYRPDGSTLVCSKQGTSIVEHLCALKNNGAHTLILGDVNDDETGGYNLYFQRTNNPVNATALNFGETISGTVGAVAEMDAFTFTGVAGGRVVTHMARTSGSFQPEVRVYRPDGILICSKIADLLSHQVCNTKTDGVHTVLVGDNGGNETGDYNLYVQRTSDPVNATPLDLGDTVSGEIGVAAEMDAFTFTGAAGDRVLTRLVRTSGSLEPEVRIYSPDGTYQCSKNGLLISDSVCTLRLDGVHTLLATDRVGTGTGDYALYIQNASDLGNATPIDFDETASGDIGMAAEMDTFTFTGAAGDNVLARLVRTSGSFQPEVRIYRPNGSLICSKSGSTFADRLCALDSDGVYSILAGDVGGDETGGYTLYVQRTNDPVNATPLGFGDTVSGEIGMTSEMDAFTFGGTAGSSVVVEMTRTSGSFQTEVRIHRPNGTLICSKKSSPSVRLTCALDTDGTYTILAGDNGGNETGNYTISLK
jgi:hypothetical protein